jgi:hypothetical protein
MLKVWKDLQTFIELFEMRKEQMDITFFEVLIL